MGQKMVYGKFLPGEKKEGETNILRSAILKEGEELVSSYNGKTSIKEIFEENALKNPDKLFMGTREKIVKENGTIEFGEYKWKKYGTTYQESKALAKYLLKHNLCPFNTNVDGTFRFIGIYAKNREEWVLTDLASILTGIASVTLYDTLGREFIEYIINQTKIKTIALQSDKMHHLLELRKQGKIPTLEILIHFDSLTSEDQALAKELNLQTIYIWDAVSEGFKISDEEQQLETVTKDSIFTICYTSGTTGPPKGSMLTHLNLCSNVGGLLVYDHQFSFQPDDIYYSYLPLSHIFERYLMITCLFHQVQYGFYQGDVLKMRDDLALLKPTILISVPRLLNRFYDLMKSMLEKEQGIKKRISTWGTQKKLINVGKFNDLYYDEAVFEKFKNLIGGRVRFMITGSAPIAKEVLSFLKIAFCCPIVEGYGQTETTAPASMTWLYDPEAGQVGPPFPTCEIKLVDVPDMAYFSTDKDHNGMPAPRGEICFRGPHCFIGYYNQPELTQKTVKDGWVYSGDIGVIIEGGRIKVIDRKKNMFKLSQGEYVVPDRLENQFSKSAFISQIFVYGDSLQNFLVAIVIPEKGQVEQWAQQEGIVYSSYGELVKNDLVNKKILQEIQNQAHEGGFFGFEIPHKIALSTVPFSVENDLLTPTFKFKRFEAKNYFFSEIKELYDGAKLQGEE